MTMAEKRKGKPLSEKRRKQLIDARNNIENLLTIIQDILDEKTTQTEAAKKLNITYTQFSNNISDQFLNRLHTIRAFRPTEVRDILIELRTPYECLVYDIFKIPKTASRIFIVQENTEIHLEHIINERLTPQEKEIITKYYGLDGEEPKSIVILADEYNVSKQRIDQILKKAIKKLKDPSVWNPLLKPYGLCTRLETDIAEIANQPDIEIPVKNITMSARLKNILLRQHITTINAVTEYTEEKIMQFRNMGKKSLNELKQLLKKYNLKLYEKQTKKKSDATDIINELYRQRQLRLTDYQMLIEEYDTFQCHIDYMTRNDLTINEIRTLISNYKQAINRNINEIPMSMRLENLLTQNGMETVNDIIQHTENEILQLQNMGETSLNELKKILLKMGLRLKEE